MALPARESERPRNTDAGQPVGESDSDRLLLRPNPIHVAMPPKELPRRSSVEGSGTGDTLRSSSVKDDPKGSAVMVTLMMLSNVTANCSFGALPATPESARLLENPEWTDPRGS